jgi:hypothetical protein
MASTRQVSAATDPKGADPKSAGPKGTSPASISTWRRFRNLLPLLLVLAFMAGGVALWRQVRGFVLAHDDYRLSPDDIDITPPPAWVHEDVRAKAFHDASLENRSILEPSLAEDLAHALARHPWVARVDRVVKAHPAGLQVDLVYRRPVCMVQLPPDPATKRSGGLYPVDGGGVLLPTADFTPLEARAYPLLLQIATMPDGAAGEPWGDPRVAGGAAIAALLIDVWGDLKLDTIVPSAKPDSETDEYTFELFTRQGTRIAWGRAPDAPAGGEAPPAEKLARLLRHAQEHGGLDTGEPPRLIDVRPWDRPAAAARTATHADEPAR